MNQLAIEGFRSANPAILVICPVNLLIDTNGEGTCNMVDIFRILNYMPTL
jgi:predicted ATPase